MADQPRCDPLEASRFFQDGQCSRHLPANTVARGQLNDDTLYVTGQAGQESEGAPQAGNETQDEATAGGENVPGSGTNQQEAQGGPPQYSEEFPYPITLDVMERGRERYDVYCAPCHSMDGEGDGMVVRRGYPAPPSLHQARLRDAQPGYLFDVITNGFGIMPAYRGQIREASDRWAIVAYVRALQLSQNATLDDIPAEERGALETE